MSDTIQDKKKNVVVLNKTTKKLTNANIKVKTDNGVTVINTSRHGKDLMLIFYTLLGLIIGVSILQIITYRFSFLSMSNVFHIDIVNFFRTFGFDLNKDSIRYQMFKIPLDIIIDSTVLYTLVYGGFEGSTSFIKTLSLPAGNIAAMPNYKIKNFFGMVWAWFFTALLLTIFSLLIELTDTGTVSFFLNKVYIGLGSSSMVYLYGRQAPKITEDLTIKKRIYVQEPVKSEKCESDSTAEK